MNTRREFRDTENRMYQSLLFQIPRINPEKVRVKAGGEMCEKETTTEYTEHTKKLILICPSSTIVFNYTAFTLFLLKVRVPVGELQY